MRRIAVVVVASVLLVGLPSRGWGQDAEEITPTPQELDLINQGVAASDAGNYELAIELFMAALSFGDLNGAYLNLGRAQQRAGLCVEAEESFARALVAPRVKGLDPALVEQYVARFRLEMQESCPGRLLVECEPPEMALTIEGLPADAASPRCGEEVTLAPGSYTILGRTEAGETQVVVEVAAAQRAHARLTVQVAARPEVLEDPEGGGLVLGLRYQSLVSYASGGVYTASDPGTAFDKHPADGTQDELEGLQISKANHGLALEVGYGGPVWVAGISARAQLPATSVGVEVFGRYRLAHVGPLELVGQGHAGYGELLQTLGTETERFVARTGPGLVGGGLELVWPLSPVAVLTGLDVTVGVPEFGVIGAFVIGGEFRF